MTEDIDPDECNCEFDPYDDEPETDSWHYKRSCQACGSTWYSLHCIHDGYQNPCPSCGVMNRKGSQ